MERPLWKILLNFTQNGYLPQIGVNIKKNIWKHQPEKFFEVWSGWVQVVFCCTLQFFNKSDMSWASPFAWKYSPELRNMRLENHGAQKYLQGQDPKSLLSNGMACQIHWISIVSMASLANKNPWINTGSSSQNPSVLCDFWNFMFTDLLFKKRHIQTTKKKQNNHEQNW